MSERPTAETTQVTLPFHTPLYFSFLIAAVAAFVTLVVPHPITLRGIGIGDIGPPIAGMMQFLRGVSPYAVELRGSQLSGYPFTTMVVLAPFLLVPVRYIAAIFFGLISFTLAEAIRRSGGSWRYLMLFSPSYLTAMQAVQWSPLFTAALLAPALLPFAVVKPQLAIVLLAAGKWSRRTFLAAGAIVLISLIVFPTWPAVWLNQGRLGIYIGRSPLFVVPGFLLLMSAIAWKRWRGRLVLAMSIVTQRFFYDQLLLFVVPESFGQMVLLLATSWTALGVSYQMEWWIPHSGSQHPSAWVAVVLGFHLPAAAIALWNHRQRQRIRSGAVAHTGNPQMEPPNFGEPAGPRQAAGES